MDIWIKKPYQPQSTIELEKAKSLVASGEIDPNVTYAWHEGIPNWMPLSQLLGNEKVQPPPLPQDFKREVAPPIIPASVKQGNIESTESRPPTHKVLIESKITIPASSQQPIKPFWLGEILFWSIPVLIILFIVFEFWLPDFHAMSLDQKVDFQISHLSTLLHVVQIGIPIIFINVAFYINKKTNNRYKGLKGFGWGITFSAIMFFVVFFTVLQAVQDTGIYSYLFIIFLPISLASFLSITRNKYAFIALSVFGVPLLVLPFGVDLGAMILTGVLTVINTFYLRKRWNELPHP